MPGKCHGSYLLPTWLWLDCTWKLYSHLGDVQPRASSSVGYCEVFVISKVVDLHKENIAYENRVVHAWCTFGPLSIVLYVSLLSDFKLVHWRSVFEF